MVKFELSRYLAPERVDFILKEKEFQNNAPKFVVNRRPKSKFLEEFLYEL